MDYTLKAKDEMFSVSILDSTIEMGVTNNKTNDETAGYEILYYIRLIRGNDMAYLYTEQYSVPNCLIALDTGSSIIHETGPARICWSTELTDIVAKLELRLPRINRDTLQAPDLNIHRFIRFIYAASTRAPLANILSRLLIYSSIDVDPSLTRPIKEEYCDLCNCEVCASLTPHFHDLLTHEDIANQHVRTWCLHCLEQAGLSLTDWSLARMRMDPAYLPPNRMSANASLKDVGYAKYSYAVQYIVHATPELQHQNMRLLLKKDFRW